MTLKFDIETSFKVTTHLWTVFLKLKIWSIQVFTFRSAMTLTFYQKIGLGYTEHPLPKDIGEVFMSQIWLN